MQNIQFWDVQRQVFFWSKVKICTYSIRTLAKDLMLIFTKPNYFNKYN